MGKKKPYTPNSQIRSALRLLWMRSRERSLALKRAKYCCEECGRKRSKELKLDVHHLKGIDWTGLIDLIRERLLQTPDELKVLCKECHDKEHGEEDEH